MTRKEFKSRWEKDETGGGLTFDDVANCAIEWGICQRPRTHQIYSIRYLVLKEAGVKDCEDYNPANYQDD